MSATRLEAASAQLIQTIIDTVLRSAAERSPELACAILNCAVPHWFDAQVVEGMCPPSGSAALSAEQILEHLRALPFCEPSPGRSAAWTFKEDFRLQLLRHQDVQGHWKELQQRAANIFKQRLDAKPREGEKRFQDPDWKDFSVEWAYHLFNLDPAEALRVVRRVCAESLAVLTSGGLPEVIFCSEFLGSLEWPSENKQVVEDITFLQAGVNALLAYNGPKALKMLYELVAAPGLTPEQESALRGWIGEIHLRDEGCFAPALEQFRKAAQLTPTDATVQRDLAEAHHSPGPLWGRLDLALQHAGRAKELAPNEPYVYEVMGRIYQLQENWDEAIAWYQKASQADPKTYHGYLGLSEVCAARGDVSGALAAIERAVQASPDIKYYALIRKGNVYFTTQRYPESLDFYAQAIAEAPDRQDAYISSGYAYAALSQWDKAEQAYRKVMELDPESSAAYVGLANLYQAKGRLNKAIAVCREAIDQGIQAKDVYQTLSNLYAVQNRLQDVRQVQEQLVRLDPEEDYASHCVIGNVWLARAWQQADVQDREPWLAEAQSELEKALTIDPNRGWAYISLAELAVLRKDQAQVEQLRQRISERVPWAQYDMGVSLGRAYLRNLQYAESETVLHAAVSSAPHRMGARLALGELYSRLGDPRGVARVWSELIAINPTLAYDALLNTGSAYQRVADYAHARSEYERAIKADPGRPEAYLALAEIEQALGNGDDAIAQYKLVEDKSPGQAAWAYILMAGVYRIQGKHGEAEKAARTAILLDAQEPGGYIELARLGALAHQEGWIQESRDTLQARSPDALYDLDLALGDAYDQQQGYKNAKRAYRQCIQRDSERVDAYIRLGQLEIAQQRFAEARKWLNRALKMDSRNLDVYRGLSHLYQSQGDLSGVVNVENDIAELDPVERYNGQVIIGQMHERADQLDEAERWFRAAKEVAPWRQDAYVLLGSLLRRRGKSQDAHQIYKEASEIAGIDYLALGAYYEQNQKLEDALMVYRIGLEHAAQEQKTDFYMALAALYLRSGEIEKAEESSRQAIEVGPQRRDAYLAFARMLADRKRWDEAIQICRQMARQPALAYDAYLSMGDLQLARQRQDQALRAYRRAIKVNPQRVEAYLALASLHQQRDELPQAEVVLQQALAAAPEHPGAYRALAELREQQQQWDEALKLYRRIIELQPDSDWATLAHMRIGSVLVQQKRYDEARLEFQQVIQIDPGNVEAYYGMGLAFEQQRNVPQALAMYKKAIELDPRYGVAYLALSRLYGEQQDSRGLARLYQQLSGLPLTPDEDYDAHCIVAEGYKRAKDTEQAIRLYRRAIGLKPDRAEAYVELAQALADRERWGEAVQACRQMARQRTLAYNAYLSIGNLYIQQRKYNQAAKSYRQAIDIDPRRGEAYVAFAQMLADQERLDKAIQVCRQMARRRALAYDAYLSIGALYVQQQEYDHAAKSYRRAIAVNPQRREAYVAFAQMLADRERWDEAVQVCRQMARQRALAYDAYLSMGDLQLAQQRQDQALRVYRRAIKVNPQRVEAYLALASLHQQRDELPQAEVVLQQALAAAPEHPEAYRALAELREQQQQWDEALKLYRRIVELQPDSDWATLAHMRIGSVLVQQKRYCEAERELQKAIELVPKYRDAYVVLSRLYGEQKDVKGLVRLSRQLVSLELTQDEKYEVHLVIAEGYQTAGLYESAVDELKKAVLLDPDRLDAHSELGRIYEIQMRWPEAREEYEKIGQLNPEWAPDVQLRLGQLWALDGNRVEAEKSYRRAIQLAAERPDAYYALAQLYRDWKRWDEAIEVLSQLATLGFDSATSAFLHMGDIYRSLGKMEEMRQVCFQVVAWVQSAESPNSDALRRLGLAHLMREEYPLAAQAFRRTFKADPTDARARFYLAVSFVAQGKFLEAQRQLERGIQLAKSRDYYAFPIEEARVVAGRVPEVPHARDLLEALCAARDKLPQSQ